MTNHRSESTPNLPEKDTEKPQLVIVDENFIVEDDYDGGGGGDGFELRVRFTGDAAAAIRSSAENLGIETGDFVRRSINLGVAATHASKRGVHHIDYRRIFDR